MKVDGQRPGALITPEQAGAILRCSRRRVSQMIRDGQLEAEQRDGEDLRIEQLAVYECLVEQLQEQLTRRDGEKLMPSWIVVVLAFLGPGLVNLLLVVALALLAP